MIGIMDNTSVSSQVHNKFLNDIVFTEGRYQVSLLWHLSVPDHFLLSLNQLRSLHFKLLKDPELLREYNHIIKEQISKGIIERIPESTTTLYITCLTMPSSARRDPQQSYELYMMDQPNRMIERLH